MNEEWYERANKINCNPLYHSKLKFMTLREIKELHRDNNLSDDVKLDQKGILSALELLEKTL